MRLRHSLLAVLLLAGCGVENGVTYECKSICRSADGLVGGGLPLTVCLGPGEKLLLKCQRSRAAGCPGGGQITGCTDCKQVLRLDPLRDSPSLPVPKSCDP